MGSFEEQLLFCKLSAVDSFKLLRGTGVSDIRVCGRVASNDLMVFVVKAAVSLPVVDQS